MIFGFFFFFLDFFFDFLDGFDFFGLFLILDFMKFFELFVMFWGFLVFFWITFKVTKVTTKSYQGYHWTTKIAKKGQKQHNKLFFCQTGKKSLVRRPSPPQELEITPANQTVSINLLTEKS